MLARRHSTGARCTADTVRTPVERSAVFIAPHCQLMYEMGCQQAIRGVCDLDYINIPDVKKRAAFFRESSAQNPIEDCGSSMAPDIERIIALNPEAILLSPFENSGGYGKLDKLHVPIIEAADYMESSPLGEGGMDEILLACSLKKTGMHRRPLLLYLANQRQIRSLRR